MGLEIGRRLIDGIWRTGSADESAGGGGGSGPFTLLGPFTVSFDEPGHSVVLWNAKAGDLIVDIWVLPTTSWAAASQLEIYCDAVDFLNPRQASGELTVQGDTTRYATPKGTDKGGFAVGGVGAQSTPSLMKIDADVICDIINTPNAGVALIWALIVPAP